MAKLKLENDILPDAQVIAISSHVNDYRLCWSLNRSLGIALSRNRSDIEEEGPEHPAFYPVFSHQEEDGAALFSLIGNHAQEGVLIASQRQADFFLVAEGENRPEAAELLGRVRAAEFVLAAFTLDIRSIKGAYKLLQ
ncbi:MAG: IPExxxVDY family protein [Bacteroidetes bacterium]|nr:IPExxxVDY family protein [Bacteroidota bacterium]